MAVFNGQRLSLDILQVDQRVRNGWYSDDYFQNIAIMLRFLAEEGYTFQGESDLKGIDVSDVETGNIEVEMQVFTRRKPFSVVAGVDEALAILKVGTGYYDEGNFVNTYDKLEIEAVQDGTFVYYEGNPEEVEPVIKIRGRLRDFVLAETAYLGVLTSQTRVATNVYNTLVAARGKDILFFPARFEHYKLQPIHGYAYKIAVEAYNAKYKKNVQPAVSTEAQASYWGGKANGTLCHAAIGAFLGDLTETMLQYARILDPAIRRIALPDYHNDCIGDTLKLMKVMFEKYWEHYLAGNLEDAKRYILWGVRPDTSGSLRDKSVIPIGDPKLDLGVVPQLIWKL